MKKFILITVVFMSVVLLTGCNSQTAKTDSNSNGNAAAAEQNNTAEAQQSNADTEPVTDNNTSSIEVTESKSLPEGWREDLVPIIDGAQIYEASKGEIPTGAMWDIEAYSTKSFDEVYTYYKDVMKDAEHLVDNTLDEGAVGGPKGTKNLLGKKGEYQISMLILPPEDGKVKLSIGLFVANKQ